MRMNLSTFFCVAALSACSAVAPAQSELKASSAVIPKADPSGEPTRAEPAQVAAPSEAKHTSSLTRVADRSTVCMVNDQYMGNPQIPVVVADKTYFGCCEMCEAKLKNNPDVRSAIDPTSQRPVDKATAVIGRDESGKVFYFENEQALAKYENKG